MYTNIYWLSIGGITFAFMMASWYLRPTYVIRVVSHITTDRSWKWAISSKFLCAYCKSCFRTSILVFDHQQCSTGTDYHQTSVLSSRYSCSRDIGYCTTLDDPVYATYSVDNVTLPSSVQSTCGQPHHSRHVHHITRSQQVSYNSALGNRESLDRYIMTRF